MGDQQIHSDKTCRGLERIVLTILTFYTLAMFLSAQMSDWSIYVKEVILVTVGAGWLVYFRSYWTHRRRAIFIAIMVWVNFVLFAVSTDSFSSMLITMAGVVVLLGVFSIPQIIYLGFVIPALVFLFHGLVVRSITVSTPRDIIRVFIEFFSIYTVSAVTWLSIRNRQDANQKLMDNISELENAERSKDDFLVNVSHEIRTPINAVCGMSEVILQENLPQNIRRDIVDIQTAGRNLLSTVSNILDFSELQSGKMELAEESYNITSTITDIINMALTLDNGRHLELVVDCDANLPSNLVGDEQKLRRIIINLLGNAIKFTREGGVILSIGCRKEKYGINLLVSVKDSGIGIERRDLEKIFTSFSQVNSKRNRQEGGVGLGLAITQALVRSMGGFISVESTPGKGSEFKFAIPQKVLDETPIVSIKNKRQLFAACYINMDKYNYSVVREGYENCIRHIVEQLGIMFRVCRNLPELKRRGEYENFSHTFIGWEEYCEDKDYFDKLAEKHTVVLLLDYGQETMVRGNMFRIYKPFTVLSIAAVFNGQRVARKEEQHISLHKRFIAPQASVLVVDDNAMNLKVMARLLLPYQIKVSMAGGGMEALEKMDKNTYDFVFLDHMMPEMDGVETLRKIRQKPGAYFQSLPVIAFTANAIGGAREMFLAEGFDDFIAKPIEMSVLERMLRRYIPTQKQMLVEDGQDPFPQGEPEAMALSLLSRAGINVEQGISYCGDKEGLREIIGIFHKEGPKRSSQLRQYFKEQDWKNYVIAVHALKSNSKGIGAVELSDLALDLEMAGKGNSIDYILENHERLMEMHDQLLAVLGRNTFVYPDEAAKDTPEKEGGPGQTGNGGIAGQQWKEGGPGQTGNGNIAGQQWKEGGLGQTGNGNIAGQQWKEGGPGQTGNGGIAGQQWKEDGPELTEDMQAVGKTEETSGEWKDIDEPTMEELLLSLKEKLADFESEGLDEILSRLAGCRCRGVLLKGLAEQLREKTSEFDFPGASDLLDQWEAERSGT